MAQGSPRFTLSRSRMRSRTDLASPVENQACGIAKYPRLRIHRHEARMTPAKCRRHPQNSAILVTLLIVGQSTACGGGDAARTSNSAEEGVLTLHGCDRRLRATKGWASPARRKPQRTRQPQVKKVPAIELRKSVPARSGLFLAKL